MPGQAVAGSTAAPEEEEEEEESSDGEPWTGYDDRETPPTSDDDEDEIGGGTGSLFDDMFGGVVPAKPAESSGEEESEQADSAAKQTEEPEAHFDGDDADRSEDEDDGGAAAAPEQSEVDSADSGAAGHAKLANEFAELNSKYQNMMMEVEMLKYKLEREQSLKQDYQDNCQRLESELEGMADDIEKLGTEKQELTDQLKSARQEDFSVPVATTGGVEALGGDGELSKALATAAADLRTEDIWEGSAKFMALTGRFGEFMSTQAEANRAESCVVEFLFAPELSEMLGGLSEKSFKVSVQNQICQILSLVCSRLHLPNSQLYDVTTMRGFELNKEQSLSSYGLGVLFRRWIIKLSVPPTPVGTDPDADAAMVRSLIDDHLDKVWDTIALSEAAREDEFAAASKKQWAELDSRVALQRRFLSVSRDGQRKALLFLMQIENEERADRKRSAADKRRAAGEVPEGTPHLVLTRKHREKMLRSMFASMSTIDDADAASLARDLQAQMRLLELSDGSRLVYEGSTTNDLYFVLSGSLRQAAKEGREPVTIQEERWYGERALFIGDYVATMSLDAHGDTVLYHLSRPDLMAILLRHPKIEAIVERLTADMLSSEGSEADAGGLSAAERAELSITTDFIKQVPMFHGTDAKCVDALARRLTTVSIPAQTVVCEKGSVGQEMFFVRDGFVEMLPELDQPAFGQKGPGSFFGEMALLNSEPRNAYCRCLTEISGYVLTKSDLQRVLIEFPAMEAMVRRPLIEKETERAREIGKMMAATATTLSRKERRREAACVLQRAGKRFVERRLEAKAKREAELAALRLSGVSADEVDPIVDNWQQVAEMRTACRDLKFSNEEGNEDEVWLDYNQDLLAWEEEQRRRREEKAKTAGPTAVMTCPANATLEEKIAFRKMQKQMEAMEAMADDEELLELGIEEVKDVREFIRDVPLFQGIMQSEELEGEMGFIEALEAKLKPTSYPAGAIIIQQGDVASAMYVVASGVAEVGNDDLSVMYGVKSEGEVFGELALITNDRRSATVRASVDGVVEVFTLFKHDFTQVVESFPKLKEVIAQVAQAYTTQ